MGDVVAVVLARGLGSRMRQGDTHGLSEAQVSAASAGQKGMMPLESADGRVRPFLDYVLHNLAEAGFTDVVLVVPPEAPPGASDPIRDYYRGPGRPSRLHVTFVVQAEPRGTAHALTAAAEALRGRPFVVLNADNLYGVDDLRALRVAPGPALVVYERDRLVATSGIPVERVGSFAILEIDAAGRLRDIVEKPGADVVAAAGGRAPISMNVWRGDAALLAACRDVPLSSRGEFELPAAVRLGLERGMVMAAITSMNPVFDLSRPGDVPAMVERLRQTEVRP